MVAPCDGLGHLQMGKARHDPIGPRLGLCQEGLHKGGKARSCRIALVAHPQAKVDRDLIVARTGGVHPLARIAHNLGQAGFDVEVDVFQIGAKGEFAALNL